MSPELALILKLQSLDIRAAELEQEIASLPKRIAEIARQLDAHKRRLEIDRAALAANQKERKSLELDVQAQEQKISKLKDQMLSAKTNEQYRAFQQEIAYCQNQIRKFEDRILDLMAESETLEQNVKRAEAALAEEERQVAAEKKQAADQTARDKQELAALKQERAQIAASLRQDFYASYERIRQRLKGNAVAEAVDDRCSGCHVALRPQVMQDLRRGAEGLICCENCKRILYYNPPVTVEETLA